MKTPEQNKIKKPKPTEEDYSHYLNMEYGISDVDWFFKQAWKDFIESTKEDYNNEKQEYREERQEEKEGEEGEFVPLFKEWLECMHEDFPPTFKQYIIKNNEELLKEFRRQLNDIIVIDDYFGED